MGIVSSYGTVELVQKVVSVEEDQDNQSLFVQVDNATRGGAKTQTYALNTGETYRIYAVGDQQRIRDIDLAVYSPSGSYIIEDSDSSNIALVQFAARSTGYYTLKITPYSMTSGIRDGFYGLVVVRVAGN